MLNGRTQGCSGALNIWKKAAKALCVKYTVWEKIMSFIITTYVREGIVMASDSLMTLNTSSQQGQNSVVQMAVGQSDSNYKTFVTPSNIGISTFGDASVNDVPIAGYIESFINEYSRQENYEVDQVPNELIAYFGSLPSTPNTSFHVAGYKNVNNTFEQHVYVIKLSDGTVQQVNPANQQGVSWGGEADIISRIVKPVFTQDQNGSYQPFPHFNIPYQFFTLQDAIDFSVYAIKMTIDTLRFQPRPKTVGGPIDVLVLKPTEQYWINRKKLWLFRSSRTVFR